MTDPNQTKQLFEVSLTLEQADKLYLVAEMENRSVSYILSLALDDFLDEYDFPKEDDPPTEPDPEDYCMGPAGPLGSWTSLWVHDGNHIGMYPTNEAAASIIRHKMEADQFWPNVWELSDHGNWRLVAFGDEYPPNP